MKFLKLVSMEADFNVLGLFFFPGRDLSGRTMNFTRQHWCPEPDSSKQPCKAFQTWHFGNGNATRKIPFTDTWHIQLLRNGLARNFLKSHEIIIGHEDLLPFLNIWRVFFPRSIPVYISVTLVLREEHIRFTVKQQTESGKYIYTYLKGILTFICSAYLPSTSHGACNFTKIMSLFIKEDWNRRKETKLKSISKSPVVSTEL